MNYTLHQLRIFQKIVENQSITKTSEELHLTQPAVSIQLKKFQEQFDVPLTETIGRRIFITDFGKEVALSADKILKEVDSIKYKTLAHQGFLHGNLKVSVVSTGKYLMPYFLSGFIHEHPGVDLTMDVTNKTRVIESLERNEVDFALVSVLPNHLQINREEIMENKIYLVGKSPLDKNNKQLNPKSLNGLPLILREKGSATRSAMESYLRDHHIQAPKSMELTSNEAVKQAVIAQLGYSIMPLIGIHNELENRDLSIIPMKGLPITTNWNLIWLKGKRFSPIAQTYLDYLRKNKQTIIDTKFDWYLKTLA